MAGMTVTIDDPEIVETKDVDSNGRLFLGKKYEGAEVRVAIEVIEYPPEEPESGSDDEQDTNPSEDTESDSKDSDSDAMPDNEEAEESEGDTSSWMQGGGESGSDDQ